MLESFAGKSLDDLDRLMLDVLQREAQLSNVELSRKVNLSPPAIHARIKRLWKDGIIDRQVVILDQAKLGFDLLCFIHVGTSGHQVEQLKAFEETVKSIKEVLECHHLTGEYDYLLKVIVKDRQGLQKFVRKLNSLPCVSRIQTSVTLEEVKYSTALPLVEDE